MARQVQLNEAVAARRRVYFQCVDAFDGMTPELAEAGGQPEVSTNGAAFVGAAAIGVLVAIGNGRYYAELTAASVNTAGDLLETRYKSANTAEIPGDSIEIVNHNPVTSIDLIQTDAAAMVVTLAAQDTELGKILGATAGRVFISQDGQQIKTYTFAGALLSTLDWNPVTFTWDETW